MQLPSHAFESSAVAVSPFPISAMSQHSYRAPDPVAWLESPSASAWSLSFTKRLFDLFVALLVLAVFGLPMLVIALCVRMSSHGPAFFDQYRVGRRGRLFRIYKFRTMTYAQKATVPASRETGIAALPA